MPKLILHLLFFFLFFDTYAQIKIPYEYIDNPINLEFDSSFIRKNKITYIENINYVRHDNNRISQKGQNNIFFFNEMGLVDTQLVITRINYLRLDTILLLHYYLPHKKIERRKEGNYYIATYKIYDDSLRLIKSITSKETSASTLASDFKLNNQKTISEETITYEYLTNNQLLKKFYNDENRLFKKSILLKDSLGKNIEENATYTATNVKVNFSYKYDALGRICEIEYYTDALGEYSEKSIFHYDFNNKLSKGEYYKNNVLIHNKTFFYNNKSGLMESIMLKFPNNSDIEFINYYFHFVEDKITN